MNSTSDKDPIVAWSFWIACVLAAAGAVAPFLLGAGLDSRIGGVLIPFAVAAVAMAANALLNQYGRLFTIVVYFVGGIAIVYGVLGMVAVKLTLLVAGSCEPPPATCPPGFQRPLSSAEDTAINVVIVLGSLAILSGFFGLMVLYRRRPLRPWAVPSGPSEPPAEVKPAQEKPATAETGSPAEARREAVEEPKELEAPDEPKELPAPEEPKELPPPA